MNQILNTKTNKKSSNKKEWFKFQFWLSTFIIIIIVSFGFIYYYNLLKKESLSNDLIDNYSIYKLYSKQDSQNTLVEENLNGLFRNHRNTKT